MPCIFQPVLTLAECNYNNWPTLGGVDGLPAVAQVAKEMTQVFR